MKDVISNESLVVPEGVTVTLKARTVTVEGPRGKIVKNVGHVAMDLQLVSGESMARGFRGGSMESGDGAMRVVESRWAYPAI